MWSKSRALECLAVDLGVPRSKRRQPGARAEVYESVAPEFARAALTRISAGLDAPLSDYIDACIVIEKRRRFGHNLEQRIYQRDARAVVYGAPLLHLFNVVQQLHRLIYHPAMVQHARRVAAKPKRMLDGAEAVAFMTDSARAFVDTDRFPLEAQSLARIIARYRRGEISDGALAMIAGKARDPWVRRDAELTLEFGIAHELSHHLLAHGREAHWPGSDHPPGKAVLAAWREMIGYEPTTVRLRAHKREYDADSLAIYLLSGGKRGGDVGIITAGLASYCLLGLSLIDDDSAQTLGVPDRGHPTYADRMTSILEHAYLAFDAVETPLRRFTSLDREGPKHPASFILQNIYVSQVIAIMIDRIPEGRSRGLAFGLGL